MTERLLRLERLIAVLDARKVPSKERARFLWTTVGGAKQSYYSNLLSGDKSFGSDKARQIEKQLGLVPGTLEEFGLPPDAASVAGAFNALPMTTETQLELRQQLYVSIMAMIQAHGAPAAKKP